MGLDITAYRKLTKLLVHLDFHGEPVDPVTGAAIEHWVRPRGGDFPERLQGLEDGAVYCYEEAHYVLSTGYGGYGSWREQLAILAGYPLTEYRSTFGKESSHAAACWQGAQGPFSELINFTDCDGFIGPVVAAKLAKDFAEWNGKAQISGQLFYERYFSMQVGLELAADGGCLHFH